MPPSEYDPLFASSSDPSGQEGLDEVRARFEEASRPYLRGPWSWIAWAVLLPAAALATTTVHKSFGYAGSLILWSVAVLAGGAVEGAVIFSSGRPTAQGQGGLSRWVFRVQGNTSLIAAALSALLLTSGLAWALPALWLLLLGHSFYAVGGLSLGAFRPYGLLYQGGGLVALWPSGYSLEVFALTTFVANLWMAWAVARYLRSHGG
ncbi:MAG: hypothetical protein AAF481_05095 [Acidobacteriota bacterium]